LFLKHSCVKYSKPLSIAIGSEQSRFLSKEVLQEKINFEANAVMFGVLLPELYYLGFYL